MRNCENPQKLLKKAIEIRLSMEEYDASKSSIKVKLISDDKNTWKSYRDEATSIVSLF